jgi:hypothetical protein
MSSLYTWLLFAHLGSLAAFLFAHGLAATVGFAARSLGANSRVLLALSLKSYYVAGPAFLILVASGIWLGVLGHWFGQVWIWLAIVILIALTGVMSAWSRPFHMAREAKDQDIGEHLARTRPAAMAWTGAVALLAILFLMVLKPF